MNIQEIIRKLYKLELNYIWSYVFDEGMNNELILNPNCIYLEIDNRFLKLYGIEGKVQITIVEKEDYISDMDITYKIDITKFILDYPETNYYIKKIGGIDLFVNTKKIICSALEIEVFTENYGKQNIFIYSGLYGLRIGGINKKNNWIQNYYIPINGGQIVESWILE